MFQQDRRVSQLPLRQRLDLVSALGDVLIAELVFQFFALFRAGGAGIGLLKERDDLGLGKMGLLHRTFWLRGRCQKALCIGVDLTVKLAGPSLPETLLAWPAYACRRTRHRRRSAVSSIIAALQQNRQLPTMWANLFSPLLIARWTSHQYVQSWAKANGADGANLLNDIGEHIRSSLGLPHVFGTPRYLRVEIP